MSWTSPPRAGFDLAERVEDLGREHVAADRGEVGRRVVGGRLLDDGDDAGQVVLDELRLDAPVQRDVVAGDLLHRDHAPAVALVDADHLAAAAGSDSAMMSSPSRTANGSPATCGSAMATACPSPSGSCWRM